MVVVPILLGFPAMFFSVPPLMVLLITMLPFSIQIAAPILSLWAAIAMIVDGSVQVCFGFLDGMLALRSVICVSQRRRCYKPHKRRSYYRRHCSFSYS
jgi:hypothetical protein